MPIPSLPLAFSYSDYTEQNVKSCIYVHQEQFLAFLNWDALVDLHFSLHFLATCRNPYEEADITSNVSYPALPHAPAIRYCEFNIIKNRDKLTEEYLNTGNMTFASSEDRLDFFVTRAEVRTAYQRIVDLARNRHPGQSTLLFEQLIVELVEEDQLVPVSSE